MKTMKSKPLKGPSGLLFATLALLVLGACDVTNPGPVSDEFLNVPEAHQAVVDGAGARVSGAISRITPTVGFATREIFPTGQTSTGAPPLIQGGLLPFDAVNTQWSYAQQGRWIAEDAIRRFSSAAEDVKQVHLAQVYLWAGFANRILGENMCDAVFDGGPAGANILYFERAAGHLGDAIAIGNAEQKTAAYAARAGVRVFMQDWSGAVSDASQVPLGFSYSVRADISDPNTRNHIHYSNANNPYRDYTKFKTWFGQYYDETGDPRIPWRTDENFPLGNATLQGFGAVPWSFTAKYSRLDDPIPLADGREMVLIMAEADLVGGQWESAMDRINSLRSSVTSEFTGEPLEPWVANSITEAWTFLKRERGIELWLEGRRLGDFRRWQENGTPGVVDWPDYTGLSPLFELGNDVCFPIPSDEIDTNPNF